MDNAIRRDILARAKAAGYPGSITEAFQAYDQGKDLVGEYMQQQDMSPQPMQVAQTPQEQEQGLRPYHEQGQIDQSMAFPDVQPNQSFNTVGMKVPINIDKVDKQGNLVESYKAVPPGITNLPTGPFGGTVIESPAKMQKGGFHQKIYTDPIEFGKANKAYNDSANAYEKGLKDKAAYLELMNSIGADNSQIYKSAPYLSKEKIKPKFTYSLNSTGSRYMIGANGKVTETFYPSKTGRDIVADGELDKKIKSGYHEYKKPTEEPVYQEKPKEYIPTKTPKLEREPVELVIPQSDRTLMPYNNTLQVLNSVKQEDVEKQKPKVVKAPTFQTGGVNKYQTGSEKKGPAGLTMREAEALASQVHMPVMMTSNAKQQWDKEGDRAYEEVKNIGESGPLDTQKLLKTFSNPEDAKKARYPRFLKGNLFLVSDFQNSLPEFTDVPPSQINTSSAGTSNRYFSKPDIMVGEETEEERYIRAINAKNHFFEKEKKHIENVSNGPEYTKEQKEAQIKAYKGTGKLEFDQLAQSENWDPTFVKKILASKDKTTTKSPVIYRGYKTPVDFNEEHGPKTWIKSKEYSEWQKQDRPFDDPYPDEVKVRKNLGGADTTAEIAMYEWRSGLPEDSRKRYFIGGLKNRVLYNKAKYKR